jgi:hypothetical protein
LPLLYLQVLRQCLRALDIPLLGLLAAGAEHNDEHVAAPRQIDPIAGAEVNAQLGDAFADGLDVALKAVVQAIDSREDHATGSAILELADPLVELARRPDLDHMRV